ncbi:MAG: hypothetical protein GYA51_00655, partial [Candidatus Methanofastidiosa archaeon]|nr:hypothetical protein [Candidatus Methanofastidiosa archaeon]
RSAYLIAEITGGKVDKGYIDVYPVKFDKIAIPLRFKRACDIIGLNLEKDKIIDLLNALNFKVLSENDEQALFEVPSYKVDIKDEIDLIEEVARLYNYDNIFAFLLSLFLNIGYKDFMGISALIFVLVNWLYKPVFTHNISFNIFILFLLVLISSFILEEISKRMKFKEKYFNWLLSKWGIKVKFSARNSGIFSEKGINIVFVFGDISRFVEKSQNNHRTLYYFFEYVGDIRINKEFLKAFEMMVMFYQNKEHK